MALANRFGASAFHEASPGILPHGLKQFVAKACVARLDRREALVDERGQEIERLAILNVVAGAQIRSAASSVHPPTNTDSRCKRSFSGSCKKS